MVKACPEESRREVIAVARKGETSVRQVAKNLGVFESCPARCGDAATPAPSPRSASRNHRR